MRNGLQLDGWYFDVRYSRSPYWEVSRETSRSSGNTEVTGDRATGLAFIGVSSQTEARLNKYVEFIARWRKVTNLMSERAFSQVWTRHLADCAHSCLVTRRSLAGGSTSDPAQVFRRWSWQFCWRKCRGARKFIALKVNRENARSYGRSLVRPMLLPAVMAVVSKCSILACWHLWTQSPFEHWPPCPVSLNSPMNSLCSAWSEFYRGDDRRQHRLKPFR
jgi:hypothetical protein